MEGGDRQEEGAGNGNYQGIERQEKGEDELCGRDREEVGERDARDMVMMDAKSERVWRSDARKEKSSNHLKRKEWMERAIWK